MFAFIMGFIAWPVHCNRLKVLANSFSALPYIAVQFWLNLLITNVHDKSCAIYDCIIFLVCLDELIFMSYKFIFICCLLCKSTILA